ncbi:hypothetical protein EZY14_008445 [Kordia sp. TARA_039_SRF]|nr:hypothetical protein EZY14_008445 [Kordia sp. TARA_039_SRF]
MRKSLYSILTMVLFLVSCSQKSTDKVNPAINFEEGFSQTLVFGTKTSANKMGFFEDKNFIHFQLDEITSDSSFVFTGKVTRMLYTSDMFGEKESLDTEVIKSLNNTKRLSAMELEMYNDVKQYLDKEFTFTLDKYGNIIQSAQYKDAGSYLDTSLIDQYSPVPMVFPAEKLAVGTTWNFETNNPLIASQKIKYTYTVDDITDDKIFVAVEMTIDGLGGLLDKNTAKGIYEIDRKTKRFIKGERTMKVQTGGGKATYEIYEL